MTMRVVTLGLVATGLTLVARAAAAQGEFHWKGKVAAGKTIEIKGVNGDVSAVAGSGEVDVTGVKSAHRSDPEDVKIEVVPSEDGVTICAVYPSDGRRENTCEHKYRCNQAECPDHHRSPSATANAYSELRPATTRYCLPST